MKPSLTSTRSTCPSAVRWEITGLPLTDQKMLLGRYRMADQATQQWVRETIAAHLERHIPELAP